MLVESLVGLLTFIAVMIPALIGLGLIGYVVGLGVSTAVQIAVRAHYLRRLMPGFGIVRHLLRAIAPTLPAASLVLLAGSFGSEGRTLAQAIGELGLYVVATIGFTLLFERSLVKEMIGYLRRQRTKQRRPDAVPA